MPIKTKHIAQAERNKRLYSFLCGSNPSDELTEWEVVALFYSALHYVDAHLATIGTHPNNHRIRNDLVAATSSFASIATFYLHLYIQSRKARYDVVSFSSTEVRALEAGYFAPIEKHIRLILGI
jgi:hypothetical protein